MKTFGKKYNFCIVTYETVPNPLTQNLRTYLLENYSADILYIYHQMLDMKEGHDKSSGYEFFKDNKLVSSGKAYYFKLYWTLLYIKDIFYTLFWCLKFGKRFDVYFASGNLNPVAGIILREIGIVKKVVYQSVDYYSVRFKNKFFNWLYFQLDKFCVRFSDETWNVSSRMVRAREEKMGMDRRVYNRQHIVSGGIWFYKTKRLPFIKINRKKMVYRGMLLEFMGVDLAIRAMQLLLKKIPDLKFEIIGTGEQENHLKNLAISLGVSKNVLFHGFVKERADVEKILSDAGVGIATFNPNMPVDRVKNSDPGKIKDYMLLGMPVITTDTSYFSKEIIDNKCGLVVNYNPEELASSVVKLLSNKKLLRKYRSNAIKFIKEFDCTKILKPNLERILKETNNHYENQAHVFNLEYSKANIYTLLAWNKSYIKRIKNFLLKNKFKNKTLLDIRAGGAYVTIEMAKIGLKVIALDISKVVLNNIKKYKSDLKLKNITTIRTNVEELPLKDESVDYIVANAVLEHLPNETKAITEWKRVLKPKGRIMITVPIKFRFVWPFLWPINFIHDKQIGHLRRYDFETLKNKFNMRIVRYFYTGHLIKAFWVIFSVIFNTHKLDEIIESIDEKGSHKLYGASNIVVIFEK